MSRSCTRAILATISRSAIACTLICVAWSGSTELALARDAAAASAVGLWWADQGAAQVEIRERDGALEGMIVWLRAPFGLDGCPLRDRQNPDEALRSRPVLGLKIIEDLRPDPEQAATWTGGSVYEPNSGRTFRLSARLEQPDRLVLRGFVGFELIGQSQTWFRVPAPGAEPRCPDASPGASLSGAVTPAEKVARTSEPAAPTASR